MPAIRIPEDTSFSLDVLGRYAANTLDEALDSSLPGRVYADARPFDYIVLGGGSFGSVLATRLFNLDIAHEHRILVLDAGPFVLPEHVQNLPPDFSPPGKGKDGTVWGQPWTSDSPQSFNRGFPGLAYCVGGRSVFWGGWSPYFIASELAVPPWPQQVVDELTTPVLPPAAPKESYLDEAARVLGTNKTNDFIEGPLHKALSKTLFDFLSARQAGPGVDVLTGNRGVLAAGADVEAPLAVASASERPGFFASNKFSSIQLLLRALRVAQSEAESASPADFARAPLFKRLMLVDNCSVSRIQRTGSRVVRLFVRPARLTCINGVYTREVLPEQEIQVVDGARVFLALGTIENTRMALSVVPEKPLIGRNLMAHLRSNLTFRIPRPPSLDPANLPPNTPAEEVQKLRELQVSALFVKGLHRHPDGTTGHYHFQITASGVGELGMNSEVELFKKLPNIEDLDQFQDLNDKWVVITVRGIGEMVGDKTSADPQNRVKAGPSSSGATPVAVVRLETNWTNSADPRATDTTDPRRTKDNDLWEAMNSTAVEVAEGFAGLGQIQYLSSPNNAANAHWQSTPPASDLCKDTLSSTHHEAGTLWMGDNAATSVTDHTGRLWEVDNLYAVGPALLPTIGSPNPMLSGVALARRAARKLLVPTTVHKTAVAGFTDLFDGSEAAFHRWRAAGPGSFALVDGTLLAQPGNDQTLFYYAASTFDDFVLRLQFRLPGPVDAFGKAVGNAGVFVRFRRPHAAWDDVNQLDQRARQNPAWVATHTGFEVQIDEQGNPDYLLRHRTGAIYDIPAGETVNGVASAAEQTFTSGLVLQPRHWYEMEVEVQGDLYITRLRDAEVAGSAFQEMTRFQKAAGAYPQRGLPSSTDSRSGYVGIQAHSGAVAFRRIAVKT